MVVVNLNSPVDAQRSELLWWLGFIKTRNLGHTTFTSSPTEQDRVAMSMKSKPRRRLLSVKTLQRPVRKPTGRSALPATTSERSSGAENGSINGAGNGTGNGMENGTPEMTPRNKEGKEETEGDREGEGEGRRCAREEEGERGKPNPVAMYGSYLEPVPVIIVASHYDLLEGEKQREAVQQTQRLVDELREEFEEYLEISPQLYPLNCLRAVSPKIRALKERLCTVRSQLVEASLSTDFFSLSVSLPLYLSV